MTQAAGKPTCYQVGGWKTNKQVQDDMSRTTTRELENLAVRIKMTQDILGKHMGSKLDANTIHQCEREGKGFALFMAKALEEECSGCETGVDADSAHTFGRGCCLADDFEARRPEDFVPKPSPLSRADRTYARFCNFREAGDPDIIVEAEETTDDDNLDAPSYPHNLRVEENLNFREKVQRLEKLFELDAKRKAEREEESVVSDTVDTDSELEEESVVSDTEDTDSEWEEDSECDDEDSEWEQGWREEVLENACLSGISEIDQEDSIERRTSARRSKKVKRFADETEHLPAGWGGSAGSNNGHCVGRQVDMGRTTADLVADKIYREFVEKDRT